MKTNIIGIIPGFENMKVAILDTETNKIKSNVGKLTEVIKWINAKIKISESIVIMKRIDMLDKSVRHWERIDLILEKWKRYEDWKKRKTRQIPEQIKKQDIQAEYFKLLKEHREINTTHQAEKMLTDLIIKKTNIVYTTSDVEDPKYLVMGQTISKLEHSIDQSNERPGSYPSLINDNIYLVKRSV